MRTSRSSIEVDKGHSGIVEIPEGKRACARISRACSRRFDYEESKVSQGRDAQK